MRFRTELEIRKSENPIGIGSRILAVGSCFASAIGGRLCDSGFSVDVNPMGILFNPLTIASSITKALNGYVFTDKDLYKDDNGVFHALAFESRRQSTDSRDLLDKINHDFAAFRQSVDSADVLMATFGTAWCFRHLPTDTVAGNCHKLADKDFERFLCTVHDVTEAWQSIVERVPRVIFTVSPVRHFNDGLHGNTLSKAILHLAVDEICRRNANAEYFPAYEALIDDLRDYRFYADDMKHPSTRAEEYIFDLFCDAYMDAATRAYAAQAMRKTLNSRHRTIIANG